ncbi:hypothetical protein HDK64DRAFT_17046 [Phyllosticta capitalensis]
MPTAADIITYVGVPLTVLGILPILWNIVKAFVIRYRLSSFLPWELRQFFNLSADPANGNVMVYVPQLQCVNLNLGYEDVEKELPLSKSMRFRRWSHKAFQRLISRSTVRDWTQKNQMGPADPFEIVQLRPQEEIPFEVPKPSHAFQIVTPKYLYCPWMMVAINCGLGIRRSHISDGIRFTVNFDMVIEKHVPLAIGWHSFIFLALALGVDISSLHSTLHSTQKEFELPKFYSDEHDTFTIVIRGSKAVEPWRFYFRPDSSNDYSAHRVLGWLNIMEIESDGNLLCQALGNKNLFRPIKEIFVDPYNWGSDPQHCKDPVAAALSWLFYESRVWEQHDRCILPVSQPMLEMRERSVCFLRAFGGFQALKKMAQSLLNGPDDRDTIGDFRDGDPVYILSTRSDDDDPVSQLVQELYASAHESTYWENSFTVYKRLRVIENEYQNVNVPSEDPSIQDDIKDLRAFCNDPLVEFGDFLIDSRGFNRLLRDLQPRGKFSKLRSMFDPFSKTPARDKVGLTVSWEVIHDQGIIRDDAGNFSESTEMTLLAHFLLAASPRKHRLHQSWEVDSVFKSLLDQLQEHLAHSSAFSSTLERALEHAKTGIYTAPSDKWAIQELLLDGGDRTVYLY